MAENALEKACNCTAENDAVSSVPAGCQDNPRCSNSISQAFAYVTPSSEHTLPKQKQTMTSVPPQHKLEQFEDLKAFDQCCFHSAHEHFAPALGEDCQSCIAEAEAAAVSGAGSRGTSGSQVSHLIA